MNVLNFSFKPQLQPIEWLLLILLLLAPLYFHPNIGGTGLRIPNNIIMWAVASLIGFYSLYKLADSQHVYLPRHFLFLLTFPVLAFFGGILSGVEIAAHWTFRILYIWGGVLFFFGMFQYQLKQGRVDRLLFMVMLSGLLHALVGLGQIIWLKDLPLWFPINPSGVPTGLFQQINNQASFQVTSIIIALWLSTRPFIRKGHQWRFIVLLLAICSGAFVVSYSGSRVGSLGFILALPLLLISRWQVINKDKKRWSLIAVVLVLSVSSANLIENSRGLTGALEKTTAMNAGFSGSARLGMYTVAFDVIKEKPILGHGIGSFVRVWQLAKPDFYAQHPDAVLPSQRVAHPHNELIFWLVEGGIVAGFGLLIVVIGVMVTLKNLPPSRRYAYAALLIPIALHTQVELPFYISVNHWFVFLFLLFVVMQPSLQSYKISLSVAARKLIKIVTVMGAIFAMGFLSHSMAASFEFERALLKQISPHDEPFPIAMKNPYFKTLATHAMMTSLFHSSMHYGLDDNVRIFAEWGEHEIKHNPHIAFYKLTVKAYLHLKEAQHACLITKKAFLVYPTDSFLKEVISQCDE